MSRSKIDWVLHLNHDRDTAQKIPGTIEHVPGTSVFNSTKRLQLQLEAEVAEAGIGTMSKLHLDEC